MAIRETWLQLRMRLLGNGLTQKYVGDEPPLRAELFSAVQMEQHGKSLADLASIDAATCAGPASGAADRERTHPDRRLRAAHGGGDGDPPDRAGRGMAAR